MNHAERFRRKIAFDNSLGGCWWWLGASNGRGKYGRFWHDGRRSLAHRYAYELWIGPIPDGLTLDHLCGNPNCVNPWHLEPVTLAENVLRGGCPPAENARKTHCKHGHEFTPENTIRRKDGRECRACRDQRCRDFKARQRARRRTEALVNELDA